VTETVGFIGLGRMGAAMAKRLVAGYALKVYNRTPAKAEPLVALGAEAASAPSGVVSPGGVVFSIVSDDQALEEVVSDPDFLARLGAGVHVCMSTVAPSTARRMDAAHAAAGAAYLCAPVFGRPPAAVAGKLWIAVSGPDEAKRRVRPMLEHLGQGVADFGDAPGAANVVKLAGNFVVGAAIEALAEACALAEKNGIDRGTLIDLLGSLFDSPVYRIYGKAVAERRYEPAGFSLALGLKDVNLVLETVEASRVPMPLASLLHDRLLAAVAKGRGELDWAAIEVGVSEDAGLTA
jgi:3-hydroxyisobutyrate dehydrogenase-like beta-hydroxyacid dehydrogenase